MPQWDSCWECALHCVETTKDIIEPQIFTLGSLMLETISEDKFKIIDTSRLRALWRTGDSYFLRNRTLPVQLMASVTSALLVPYCFPSPDLKEKNKAFLVRMEKTL